MTEGKSLYENPANRGAAAILGNAWQTPLAMLQQSEQQKRLDAANAAKAQADEEKALRERVKSFTPEIGDLWEPDLERGSAAVAGIRDYLSESLAKGVDPTNAAKFPKEYAEMNRMIADTNSLVARSKQQKASYDGVLKTVSQKADYFDLKKVYGLTEQYKLAKTPEERSRIQLELKRMHKPAAYAADIMKSIDPNQDTKFEFQKNGAIVTKDIKTYSPEQLSNAALQLQEVPEFREFLEDEFEQMSEEQRAEAGGLEGLKQSRSKEFIGRMQEEQITRRYGVNGQLNANRNFELANRREARQAAKDAAGSGQEEESAVKRVEWMESLRTGDIDKAQALINSKVGGKGVVNARFVNDRGVSVPRNEKIGTKDLFNLKETPIIELEVAVGDVTNDDGTGKTKATQTRKVKVDMSKPGWELQVNSIYDTLVGEKRKVSPEKFDEMAKKLKLFQEGSKTFDPKKKEDPFADFDEFGKEDPFADFK